MLPQPINITYIAAPDGNGLTYVIKDNDNIINVDTTLGPVSVYLPNIRNSGIIGNPRYIQINDRGNNAGVNPITIFPSGDDTINGEQSLILNVNKINVQCTICDYTIWNVNDLGLKVNLNTEVLFPDGDGGLGIDLTMDKDAIYGTITSPISGNIDFSNFDNAKLGTTVVILHGSDTEPTFSPNLAFKLSGTYSTTALNFIYVNYIDIGNAVYTISQGQ